MEVSPNESDRSEVSSTLTSYLGQYSLGEKIRRLRLRKSMGLVELGRHTGLSAAMLSKLENGHVVPTLQTLSRIAMVFSVGLDHFFGDPAKHRSVAVTRKEERMNFDEKLDTKEVLYSFQCLDYTATDRKSSSYLSEFRRHPNGSLPMHTHEGHEFIYILSGSLLLRVEEEDFVLTEADSAYFSARLPHGYQSHSEDNCRAIVVIVP